MDIKGVKGTFVHDSAISAMIETYFLKLRETLNPAECKDFAAKRFLGRANL